MRKFTPPILASASKTVEHIRLNRRLKNLINKIQEEYPYQYKICGAHRLLTVESTQKILRERRNSEGGIP
jgi:hypothetical protein